MLARQTQKITRAYNAYILYYIIYSEPQVEAEVLQHGHQRVRHTAT